MKTKHYISKLLYKNRNVTLREKYKLLKRKIAGRSPGYVNCTGFFKGNNIIMSGSWHKVTCTVTKLMLMVKVIEGQIL